MTKGEPPSISPLADGPYSTTWNLFSSRPISSAFTNSSCRSYLISTFYPGIHIRYNIDLQQLALTELGLGVKDADGVHVIAKQLYPVRLFVTKGIDVEDAAAQSELTGLIYKVGPVEPFFYKTL